MTLVGHLSKLGYYLLHFHTERKSLELADIDSDFKKNLKLYFYFKQIDVQLTFTLILKPKISQKIGKIP